MQRDRIEHLLCNREKIIIIGTPLAILHLPFQLIPSQFIPSFHKLFHPEHQILASRHHRTNTIIFIQQIGIMHSRPQFRFTTPEVHVRIRPFQHIFLRYACPQAILCQTDQQRVLFRIPQFLFHLLYRLFQSHLIEQINRTTTFVPRLHPLKRQRFLLFHVAKSRFARHLQRLFECCRNSRRIIIKIGIIGDTARLLYNRLPESDIPLQLHPVIIECQLVSMCMKPPRQFTVTRQRTVRQCKRYDNLHAFTA